MISYPRFLKGTLTIAPAIKAFKMIKGDLITLEKDQELFLAYGEVEKQNADLVAATDTLAFTFPKNYSVNVQTVNAGEWAEVDLCAFFVLCNQQNSLQGLITDGTTAYVLKNYCTGNFTDKTTVCVHPDANELKIFKFKHGGIK